MPELTPQQKAQLDSNIRAMLSKGASQDDVIAYSKDFRNKYDVAIVEPSVKKKVGIFASGAKLRTSSPATSSLLNGGGGEGGETVQRGIVSKSLGIDKSPEYDIADLNELLSKREKLNKSPIPEYVSKNVEGDFLGTTKRVKEKNPQYDSYKSELADINSQIEDKTMKSSKHLGLDPDIANKVIQDFPNETNLNNLKQRASLINENPIQYERISAAHQNQQKIAEVAGNHVANQYNDLNQHGGTYIGLVQNLPEQIDIINQNLTGKDRDRAIENLRISSGHNLNATVPDIQYEYEHSGLKEKGIDADQYAGLLTLKYFSPKKYEQAVKFINQGVEKLYEHSIDFQGGGMAPGGLGASHTYENTDPTGGRLSQKTISEQTQQEQTLHELLSIGRNNAKDYLIEHNNSLNKQYSEATTQEQQDAIAAKSLQNVMALKSIAQNEQHDAERFPLQHKMQLEQMAKELTQEKGENVINYFFRKLAEGADAPRKSFENFATATFGGRKSNTELQRRRGGESIIEQQDEILPSSYGANTMQSLPVFSKDTKEAVQKIKEDKSLSSFEKKEKIQDLADDVIKNNKVDWVTNPEFGKTKNLFSLATLYGNANMLAGLSELALETVGLKGLGAGKFLSAGLPMYVMEEQNQYKEAVSKGLSNPEEYAVANALPMFLLASGVSQLDVAKRALGGTEAAKVLENMTETEWANIASKNSRRISAIKNSLGKTLHSSSDLLLRFGVAPQVAQAFIKQGMFDDSRTVGDAIDESVKNLGNSIIDAGGLLLLTGVKNYKEVSPTLKASIWNISQHPELSVKEIIDQVEQKQITQEVADSRIKTIKQIEGIINEIPTHNKKNQLLTDRQRMDLLVTKLLKDGGDKKAENEILSKKQDEVVPEKPDELKEIADQALNKVPTEGITDEMNLQAAIKTYGKDKVKEAIEASLPLELKKNEDELASIENPKQGDIDFHNEQAQEIKSKHEAALKELADENTPDEVASGVSGSALKDGQRDISQFANENESYRVIVGDEAFNDIIESGVVRTNADSKSKKEGGIDLGNRPTAFPSFSKGKASVEYANENPNNYIIVTDDASIQPSKSGRHGKGTTMFPTDENGNHLKELSGEKVKVYKHIGDGKYELVYANGKKVAAPTQYTEAATPAKKQSEGVSGSALKDVEKVYNEKKQAIEDKLNQQLEDNKDRLDDIDEKGGTKTVRQKIYQEHTNEMVELEKWKMKEDLKNEKLESDKTKKDAVDEMVDFADNNLGKDNTTNPTTGKKLFELNKERLNNAVSGLRDKIANGTLRQVTKAIQTVREVLNVSFNINNRELGKQTEQKIDDIGIRDAKKRTDKELLDHVDELENVKRYGDSYVSYKDTRGDTQYMMGNDNFDPYLTEAVNRGLVEIKDGKLTNNGKAPTQYTETAGSSALKDVESTVKAIEKNPSVINKIIGDEYYHGTSLPKSEPDFTTANKDKGVGVRSNAFMGTSREQKSPFFFITSERDVANDFAQAKKEYHDDKVKPNEKHTSRIIPFKFNEKNSKILDLTKDDYEFVLQEIGESPIDFFGMGMYEQDQMWEMLDEPKFAEKLKSLGYDAVKFIEPKRGIGIAVLNTDKIVNSTPKGIAEAYQKAKDDGSNPELVKAVEDLLTKAPTQYTEAATPKEQAQKIADLTEKRDRDIAVASKPEIKMEFVPAKDLVDSKDPIGNKKIHTDIKDRYKKLRELIDCLHG